MMARKWAPEEHALLGREIRGGAGELGLGGMGDWGGILWL